MIRTLVAGGILIGENNVVVADMPEPRCTVLGSKADAHCICVVLPESAPTKQVECKDCAPKIAYYQLITTLRRNVLSVCDLARQSFTNSLWSHQILHTGVEAAIRHGSLLDCCQ